jgi:ATP-dependent Lhr-like helicase
MADGFAPIRARVAGIPLAARASRISRLGRLPATTAPAAGRWSRVPAVDPGLDRDEVAEAAAEQLLNRWGVVFRALAVHDSLRLPWRELQWALRRLEDRGLVRGGRFVSGFGGEQYALAAAAEQLARVRRPPATGERAGERAGERIVVNATDPLNLVGVVVPGDTVPAVRTNTVVYVDGIPEPVGAAPSRSA